MANQAILSKFPRGKAPQKVSAPERKTKRSWLLRIKMHHFKIRSFCSATTIDLPLAAAPIRRKLVTDANVMVFRGKYVKFLTK
jgi:hypothetical protein